MQKRLDDILVRAYILPDGRRVFRTEDGTRVYDEFGVQVDASVVTPAQIGNQHPSWETYQPELEETRRLQRERQAILQYQERLDEARERLNSGAMTCGEYDRLRGELHAEMPEAVRRHVPGMEEERDPAPDSAAIAASASLEISDDMVPTSTMPIASASIGLSPGIR